MNLLQKESYPSFPNDWKNPENTVFREFYPNSSSDSSILYRLVNEHMPENGNEGVTRHRLMYILLECKHRALYMDTQKKIHPE